MGDGEKCARIFFISSFDIPHWAKIYSAVLFIEDSPYELSVRLILPALVTLSCPSWCRPYDFQV